VRPGGATRRKWGILDEKDESGLMSDSKVQGGIPRLCWLRTASVVPCCNNHWVVYWRIRDLWGPVNLVTSMVVELVDTPLYFTDDIGIVFGPPRDYPSRFSRGRQHEGTVRPAQLFDSQCERWPLVIHMWFTCVMLSGYFPCKVTIDSNLHDTLGYGWGLFVVYKRRSAISLSLYEIMVMLIMTTW
jgi:hypothetical protein